MNELVVWFGSLLSVLNGQGHQHDYVGDVAAAGAYAVLAPAAGPSKPDKPPDPNCPTCKGTGKVPSGDGLGWSNCPTCQPLFAPAPAQPVIPEPAPAAAIVPRETYEPAVQSPPITELDTPSSAYHHRSK